MRRFLTMVTVSGTVMSALALAMAPDPTIARHMRRPFPVFSLTATPMSASAPARRSLTIAVIRKDKPEQPEPAVLTLRWPDAATGDRLTVLPGPCAFELMRTTPACFYTVHPKAATQIDPADTGTDTGTAPDGATPAVATTQDSAGQAGSLGSIS